MLNLRRKGSYFRLSRKLLTGGWLLWLAAVIALNSLCFAQAQRALTTVASLHGKSASDLAVDSRGNLFGMMQNRASLNFTLFEIAAGSHTITPLAPSLKDIGKHIKLDSSGNLFGTTNKGLFESGTVFEIMKGSHDATTLASFHGEAPDEFTVDSKGNIFGTTVPGLGGPNTREVNTIFEIVKGSHVVTTLASFHAVEDVDFKLDTSDNIFGTVTHSNITSGFFFEIIQGSHAVTTLGSFHGGFYDIDALDSAGDVFGTSITVNIKGSTINIKDSTIFEIARGSHTVIILASFHSPNPGLTLVSKAILDSAGDLFVAIADEKGKSAAILEIAKGSHTVTTLASFPNALPVLYVCDNAGNLFGAAFDDKGKNGTFFEIAYGGHTITPLAPLPSSVNPLSCEFTLDSAGNLFETTDSDKDKSGTIFEIAHP